MTLKCLVDNTNKRIVYVYDEDIEKNCAELIARYLKGNAITGLRLYKSRISYDCLKYLADVLPQTEITHLSLEENNIKDKDVDLSKVLKDTQITDRNLNSHGANCIKYLADVLPETGITHLCIRKNNIEDEGLKHLSKILKDTKIIDLNLESNSFGYDAALCLNKILNSTKIGKLSLDIFCTESSGHGTPCVKQFSRLHKTKMYHDIRIENCKIEIDGFDYFNEIFQTKEIHELIVNSAVKESTAEYLSQALRDVVIHNLEARQRSIWDCYGGGHMVQAFKGSYITCFLLGPKRGCPSSYSIKFLEEVNILCFVICDSEVEDYGMSLLAPAIKKSNIIELTLSSCDIGCDGLKYLSQVLRDTKIVYLDLTDNCIGSDGLKYLADGLPGSQITNIKLDQYLYLNKWPGSTIKLLLDVIEYTNVFCIEFYTYEDSIKIKRTTISVAEKLCNSFKTIVSLNPAQSEFEFVLPKNSTSVEQYVFLMKTLLENANSKVHIFYMICRYEDPWTSYRCIYDHNMIKKIDEFISAMPSKFNTFFNDKLPDLIGLICSDCMKCVNIVKQFEEAQLNDIVLNLLLHRVLYCVDENQEILHPYIYKLLNKYNMPLYNEQMEPNKKEKIISYYQDHPDIDGAKEIINFLRSKSCDSLYDRIDALVLSG